MGGGGVGGRLQRAVPAAGAAPARAGAAGREGVKASGLYDNELPGNIGREPARRASPPPPREPELPGGAASAPAWSGRAAGRSCWESSGREGERSGGGPREPRSASAQTSPQPAKAGSRRKWDCEQTPSEKGRKRRDC